MIQRFWIFVSVLWSIFWLLFVFDGRETLGLGMTFGGLGIWWFLYWVIKGHD